MSPRYYFAFILVTSRSLHAGAGSQPACCCCVLLCLQGETLIVDWNGLPPVMSTSTSPPPLVEVAGNEGCFPPDYKPFNPEEHGLDRGFRLTSYSDLKGWGCKVPQEALLKLLAGLEPNQADGTGKSGDQDSEFGQQLAGPRLGEDKFKAGVFFSSIFLFKYLFVCWVS